MKYRINKVNSWNGWDPLKQVVLGNCYSPEWFRDIKDSSLREMIQKLMSDTLEDLDGIQKTLENLGVDVVRIPENTIEEGTNLTDEGLDSWGKFNQYIKDNKLNYMRNGWSNGLPKPMITPRDYFIVLGDRFFQTSQIAGTEFLEKAGIIDPDIVEGFTKKERENRWDKDGYPSIGPLRFSKQYKKDTAPNWKPEWDQKLTPEQAKVQGQKLWKNSEYMQYTWNTFGFWAPIVTRVGDTLIVDHEDYSNLGQVLLDKFPEFEQTHVAIGGHNDGTFSPVKPGHIVTANWKRDYSESFPGWQVHVVEHPEQVDWSQFQKWLHSKHDVNVRKNWYQEGEMSDQYINFVDDWMNNWVGYVEETVFEVNMLSVSEDTILCLNDNETVQDHLRSIGMTPIYCRFRNRHFWDGGLHCLTLDTVREGGKQNYFNS